MFRCKSCGYEAESCFEKCPACGAPPDLDGGEIEALRREIAEAQKNKEFETVYYDRMILAGAGDTVSEREYAKLLERGELGRKDPEAAREYYRRAAGKNDPYACYRYACYLRREDEPSWIFRMKFAALLGCPEAYPECAKLLEGEGDFAGGNYYRELAAVMDDRESLLELAFRRYGGTFGVCSEGEAKWYLERLGRIPLRALGLWRSLRGVAAVEPKRAEFPDRHGYLLRMLAESKKAEDDSARFALNEILVNEGDLEAVFPLGIMYAEGIGTESDIDRALEYLSLAAKEGSGEALVYLGRMFEEGELVERDIERAVAFFEKAAEHGVPGGLERIGDLYREGEIVPKSIAAAIAYYQRAASGGSAGAKMKAEELAGGRDQAFRRGMELLGTDDKEAFSCFTEAGRMGLAKALLCLGKCYEFGIGTEKDRPRAYLCYRAAAEKGIDEAWYPLGVCYAQGIGVDFNWREAKKSFIHAKSAGDDRAEEQLRILTGRRNRALLRKAYSKAMRLIGAKKFKEAAEQLKTWEPVADGKMLYTLGCLYEFGIGIQSNRVRSTALYEKARAKGYTDPGMKYKRMILKVIR